MKLSLLLVIALFPFASFAYVSGIDDNDSDLSKQEQASIDAAITSYYQHPEVEKVNTVLDIMNSTEILRRKTAWSPLVGFLTVVFSDNKNRVFDWITRNDYNSYAQDAFITALLHAKLNESAAVFAQAHGWLAEKVKVLRLYNDTTDFKKLTVIIPSHIDALWGAFFASGDTVYVENIIDVLFLAQLPPSDTIALPPGDVLGEDKRLAATTLNYYAASDQKVNDTIQKRIHAEKDKTHKLLLESLLMSRKPQIIH